MMNKRKLPNMPHPSSPAAAPDYDSVVSGVVDLLEQARRASVRAVNSFMTATYWEIGRRIVEYEQGGKERAAYGEGLLKRLSADLSARFGRGFSERSLERYRAFYLNWIVPAPVLEESEMTPDSMNAAISTTVLTKSDRPVSSCSLSGMAARFPLPWSHYLLLLSVKKAEAREFYEAEALRGGWSVRQLRRQIESQFYERTALSRNKSAMLTKGAIAKPEDTVSAAVKSKIRSYLSSWALRTNTPKVTLRKR